jgi:hypothetical protein
VYYEELHNLFSSPNSHITMKMGGAYIARGTDEKCENKA